MPMSAMKARFQIAECSSLYQQRRTGVILKVAKFLARLLIRIETSDIESTCSHFPGMHLYLLHHIMREISWGILATTILYGMSYFL